MVVYSVSHHHQNLEDKIVVDFETYPVTYGKRHPIRGFGPNIAVLNAIAWDFKFSVVRKFVNFKEKF